MRANSTLTPVAATCTSSQRRLPLIIRRIGVLSYIIPAINFASEIALGSASPTSSAALQHYALLGALGRVWRR